MMFVYMFCVSIIIILGFIYVEIKDMKLKVMECQMDLAHLKLEAKNIKKDYQ